MGQSCHTRTSSKKTPWKSHIFLAGLITPSAILKPCSVDSAEGWGLWRGPVQLSPRWMWQQPPSYRATATFSHFSTALLSLAELLSSLLVGKVSSRLTRSCSSVEVLGYTCWSAKCTQGAWVCILGHPRRRASPEGLENPWDLCPVWKQHVNYLSKSLMFTAKLWTGSLEEADSNTEFAPGPFVPGPSGAFVGACAGAQGRVCVSCFLSIGLNVLSDHVIVCVWWAIWKLWGFKSVLGI